MTEDEYLARQAAIYRGRELVDDWEDLQLLGSDALLYC
jgi:hypothetical protein